MKYFSNLKVSSERPQGGALLLNTHGRYFKKTSLWSTANFFRSNVTRLKFPPDGLMNMSHVVREILLCPLKIVIIIKPGHRLVLEIKHFRRGIEIKLKFNLQSTHIIFICFLSVKTYLLFHSEKWEFQEY